MTRAEGGVTGLTTACASPQLGWRTVFCQELLSWVRLEERFAVVAAEQEDEAVQKEGI